MFYRQFSDGMYPAWAFLLPSILFRVPYSLLKALVFSAIVTGLTGLMIDTGRSALRACYLHSILSSSILVCNFCLRQRLFCEYFSNCNVDFCIVASQSWPELHRSILNGWVQEAFLSRKIPEPNKRQKA